MATTILLTPLCSSSVSSPSRPTPSPRSGKRPIIPRSRRTSLLLLLTLGVGPSHPIEESTAAATPTTTKDKKAAQSSYLGGIANTKSWLQYYGDGFVIRVPPLFEDVTEPEDLNAGLSLYGDRAKPRTLAARFASPDRSEVVSVVIRPTNQLKITFLEAQDIADLGSLRSAAGIFVPGGATLYNARTIRIKEDDDVRSYYFYEFGIEEQRVALMAGVDAGKAFIAGAAAPRSRWEDDGVYLRSAAVSLSVL